MAKLSKEDLEYRLKKEFSQVMKLPTLWTPSYFVGSVGNVSTETVRKYIESQKASNGSLKTAVAFHPRHECAGFSRDAL